MANWRPAGWSRWLIACAGFVAVTATVMWWYLAAHVEREQVLGTGVVVRTLRYHGARYTVAQVDLKAAKLRAFWKRGNGQPYRTFADLAKDLQQHDQRLVFATNAGIFDGTFTPCGLHVEDGKQLVALNRQDGLGNFYLKPNGVFAIEEHGAAIWNSTTYPGTRTSTRLAVQSGPTLLLNGKIHPQFQPSSENRRIRSGVGVHNAQRVFIAISEEPVTFHAFASLFRDYLKCPDALYLDGEISQFYLPERRSDGRFAGMLAVVEDVTVH